MPFWKFYTRDQKEVYKKLKSREAPSCVVGAGWGFLDHFFIFLFSLGFFARIDFRPKHIRRAMVPTILMILTYEMKQLMGISSMNKLEDHLFRDTALLRIIGFTARQIKEGFCERGKGKRLPPMHRDTLADFLSRLSPKEVDFILEEAVRVLVKNKLVKGRTFILDATDLPTTRRYKGCGVKKVEKEKKDKHGNPVEVIEYRYGYKLLVIMEAKRKMVVGAKVVKINEHEKNWTRELIVEAQRRTNGAIKYLLVDRGFIDGKILWWLWKEMKIRFIIPARKSMDISKDIRGFRSSEGDGERIFWQWDRRTKVLGVKGLLSYDQFGDEEHNRRRWRKDFRSNPINAVMVVCWKGKEYKQGEEKVFLTNLSVNAPMDIIKRYDLRSEIENQGFRELKQGYNLLKFPQKSMEAVIAHVILTLIIYSIVNAYKTERGQRLTGIGIRRWRQKHMAESIHKIIIYYDEIYGIVDVEELFHLIGMTPGVLFRLDVKELRKQMD